MVGSKCFKMNYFLVILQMIKDATNTNLLYFSFNKPHTSAIFPAPKTISCNRVLRQDVDLCDVHCCLVCLAYKQCVCLFSKYKEMYGRILKSLNIINLSVNLSVNALT